MRRLSVTITMGAGSERHNHDVKYREGLDHTTTSSKPGSVIEIVPYNQPYNAQINALIKPKIDAYNADVERRYQAAWERYNKGEIKSKPKRKDYQPITDYNYAEAHADIEHKNPHTGKMEKVPLWRSCIIGIGDQEDRTSGNITEEEARRILSKNVEKFRQQFPALHILGATLHLDEKGFYHAHLDYFVMYDKPETPGKKTRGLKVGHGLDGALASMGYKPEQSIINERDKAPILFNAMRNAMYRSMEAAMLEEGIGLEYGVTAKKEPTKDSSKNQSLEAWQRTQDTVREMQRNKNTALDILTRDDVTPEEIQEAMASVNALQDSLKEVEASPRNRIGRQGHIVSFKLLDQMKSVLNDMVKSVSTLLNQAEKLKEQLQQKTKELMDARAEAAREKANAALYLKSATAFKKQLAEKEAELDALRPKGLDALISAARETPEQRRIRELEKDVAAMRKFMDEIHFPNGETVLDAYNEEAAQRAQERRSGYDAR